MEDTESRVQTLPCRSGDFLTGLLQFRLPAFACECVGFSVKDIVLLYALFNISFVVAAPVIGKLGDRIGRTRIVVLSYLTYLVMSVGFAFATTKWQIVLLFVIYGVLLFN